MSLLMGKIDRCDALSVADDAASRRGSTTSPADKPKKSEWNKKKTFQEHIGDISLEGILSGKAKIRGSMRWAKRFLDEMDKKSDLGRWTTLKNHLDRAEECFNLCEADWTNLDMVALKKLLDPVLSMRLEMPSVLKWRLITKHALHEASLPLAWAPARVRKMLNLSSPWCIDGEVADFDPQAPRLCEAEGSPAEKSAAFVDFVVDRMMCPAIQAGVGGRDAMLSICSTCLETYCDLGAVPDTYLEVLSRLLTLWRGITRLLTPLTSEFCAEAELLHNASMDRRLPETDPVKKASAVMWSEGSYKEQLVDFLRTKVATQRCIIRVVEIVKCVEQGQALSKEDLISAVQVYSSIHGQVRQGVADGLMAAIIPEIEAAKETFSTRIDGDMDDGELAEFTELFQTVAKTVPASVISVGNHLPKANLLAKQRELSSRSSQYAERFLAITPSWLESSSPDEMEVWLSGLVRVDETGMPTVLMETVAQHLVDFVGSLPSWGEKVVPCIDIGTHMLDTTFFDVGGAKLQLEMLKMCKGMVQSAQQWELLGASQADRIKNDTGLKVLRMATAKLQEVKESLAAAVKAIPLIVAEKDRVADSLSAATAALLKERKLVVNERLGVLERNMSLVVGAKKNWKDKLSPSADWVGVRGLAKRTILKSEPEKPISVLCNLLEDSFRELQNVVQVFGMEEPQELKNSVNEALKSGNLAVWEAKVVMGCEQVEGNPVKGLKLASRLQEDRTCDLCWSVRAGSHVSNSDIDDRVCCGARRNIRSSDGRFGWA